jgi:hypothetical protein
MAKRETNHPEVQPVTVKLLAYVQHMVDDILIDLGSRDATSDSIPEPLQICEGRRQFVYDRHRWFRFDNHVWMP